MVGGPPGAAGAFQINFLLFMSNSEVRFHFVCDNEYDKVTNHERLRIIL